MAAITTGQVNQEKVTPFKGLLRRLGNQETILVAAITILVIFVSLYEVFGLGRAEARFIRERNIILVLQGNAYIAVAAIGMSLVIISGNIDISVGAVIGVLAVIGGNLAVWLNANGLPVWIAWIVPIFLGGMIGAVNGFLVAFLRIPAIVVTLGMMSILKGGLITVTGGQWISDLPPEYFLSQQRPLAGLAEALNNPGGIIGYFVNILSQLPMPVYFMIILTIIAAWWMRYSPLGRAIYAVGGNAEAARLSGLSPRGVLMRVFILNGIFVGIASVLFATQLSIIQSTVPAGIEMLIISSAVVGGVSILGGTGTVVGAMFAAILLNAITSALIFINVSPYWSKAPQGLLILLTVLADISRRRRQSRQISG